MSTERRPFLGGFWVTSLGTLGSRVLGLVRDMATAALLGLGETGVMDAFVVAFRIPNSFRRVLGEGALATSYLPVLVKQLERDKQAAWKLVSVVVTWLAVILAVIVVVGEGLLGLWWASGEGSARTGLLVGLSAVLLPYLWFICLAAQLSTTLQALGRFRAPALVPVVLNVAWLLTVWLVAPRVSDDPSTQALVLAACVVAAGAVQLGMQLPPLWACGFRFDYQPGASRAELGEIGRSLGPVMIALAVTQLNTLADSLIAWALSSPTPHEPIAWLGGRVEYPMQTGAAAAVYYGERFYQLPVGILGMAIATVIYPRLSRRAARGDRELLAGDLSLGLRLVWFATFPAGVGLVLLAQPATRLLFERGQFDSGDTVRTARMIACYSLGVWAYCAGPILVRGYYALADRTLPAAIGLAAVALNLSLNLTLIWFWAEAGLAIATAAAAMVQTALLAAVFSRRHSPLAWPEIGRSVVKTLAASGVLAAAVWLVQSVVPPGTTRTQQVVSLFAAMAAGIASYVAAAWLLRMPELRLFLGRDDAEDDKPLEPADESPPPR